MCISISCKRMILAEGDAATSGKYLGIARNFRCFFVINKSFKSVNLENRTQISGVPFMEDN